MAWKKIDDTKLTAIADAIRGKTGGTEPLTLGAMPTEIAAIETGVDTSKDTVTAIALVEGYTAHDASGNPIVGINPYAMEETDATVNTQATLIEQIQASLKNKTGGGAKITIPGDEVTYTNTNGEVVTEWYDTETVIEVMKNTTLCYWSEGITWSGGISGPYNDFLYIITGDGAFAWEE